MLLVPFVCAVILARQWNLALVPALIAVLAFFLVREPAVQLYRQAFMWKRPVRDQEAAWRSLFLYTAVAAASGLLLVWLRPAEELALLGLGAALLTLAAIYLAAHNQQRSVALQVVSAAGLNTTAFVAWLALRPTLEAPVWWLWALQFAHSTAAVLTVHARLEARVAANRQADLKQNRRRAFWAQCVLLFGSAILWWQPLLAVAVLTSATVHLWDLTRLRDPKFLRTPLQQVGLRELGLSFLYSAFVLMGLLTM